MSEKGPENTVRLVQNMTNPLVSQFVQEANDKYLHWDKLRFHPMPNHLDPVEAWALVQLSRTHRQRLPLTFKKSANLAYMLTPQHQEWLQIIDREAGWSGVILKRSPPNEHRRFLVNSLMEEAIASSQLEGAVTTRKCAKELLRSRRKPRNDAERMVINNYRAVLHVRENLDERMSPEMLCNLQRILTDGMMPDPNASGRFRRPDEDVVVADTLTGDDIDIPPEAGSLPARCRDLRLCQHQDIALRSSRPEGDCSPFRHRLRASFR